MSCWNRTTGGTDGSSRRPTNIACQLGDLYLRLNSVRPLPRPSRPDVSYCRADFCCADMDQNLVLLTPILVTAISAQSLFQCARSLREVTPFLLCVTGVLYGAVIGLLRHASADVFYGLFNWLAPVVLGLSVYLQWPLYRAQRVMVANTFLLGVLVMGVYGIYQYHGMSIGGRACRRARRNHLGARLNSRYASGAPSTHPRPLPR